MPVDRQDADEVINEDDLHAISGLEYMGVNEDGDDDWIGTKKAWDKFAELLKERESYE